MDYNLIYYGNFHDAIEDRIDIYIKQLGFAGIPEQLKLAAKPIVISYANKDITDVIFASGCKINVINDTGDIFKYDSIFSIPERSNRVEIVKTPANGDPSIFLFEGYVFPEMYSTSLGKNINVTISATDQLSTLDRTVPKILVDTSSYRADEYINAFDIIGNILLDTEVTSSLLINSAMENINYKKDDESTVFNNIFLCADNFESKRVINDSKTVMEKILKPFYSRVYYHDRKWKLERVPDIGDQPKKYITYYPETDISSMQVLNDRINLSCYEHYVMPGPNLLYDPGYQQLNCTLNYQKPDSLVENYFYDVQPLNASEASNDGRPNPIYREWMVSKTPHTNYKGDWNILTTWPDTSLWTFPMTVPGFDDTGVFFWTAGVWGTQEGRNNWSRLQTLSTMIQFQQQTQGNELVVDVKYKVAADKWQVHGANNVVRSKFALRSIDRYGVDWWVAKANINDTSTYWASFPYFFDTSTLADDFIKESKQKYFGIMEVSNQINISGPIMTDVSLAQQKVRRRVLIGINDSHFFFNNPFNKWKTQTIQVPTNPQYINHLFLDVYMFELIKPDGPFEWQKQWNSQIAWFGDFDVDIQTDDPANYLEASIGYYNSTKNISLDTFDSESIMFTNGIYNVGEDLELRSIDGWKDRKYDTYNKLQHKYMEDLTQLLSIPRYSLELDVKSTDSNVWNVGNIFTHDRFVRDGKQLEFICNGLDYNVKDNAYRLKLQEYIHDSGWRIGYEYCYFDTSPGTLSFSYTGGSKYMDISTNRDYDISIGAPWLTYTYDSSTRIKFDASLNTGATRDTSLIFNVEACDPCTYVINTTQDSSSALWTIDLSWSSSYDNYIPIIFTGIPDGLHVDVSVWTKATAVASNEPPCGTNYSASSQFGIQNGGFWVIASAAANATGCPDYKNVVDTQTRVLSNVTNASTNTLVYTFSNKVTGVDGESFALGEVQISGKVIETGVAAPIGTYRITWNEDGKITGYQNV